MIFFSHSLHNHASKDSEQGFQNKSENTLIRVVKKIRFILSKIKAFPLSLLQNLGDFHFTVMCR